jgi:hypothetical protein
MCISFLRIEGEHFQELEVFAADSPHGLRGAIPPKDPMFCRRISWISIEAQINTSPQVPLGAWTNFPLHVCVLMRKVKELIYLNRRHNTSLHK